MSAVWEQVPAYRESPDPRLREGVAVHLEAVFRVLLARLVESRPAQAADFPTTRDQAFRRVGQGVALADFLRAFRVGQMTLWQGVLAAARNDAQAREAALSVVGDVMQLIEVGSTVAAEAYLEAQQRQIADSDRVRRDLLEDLLARRDLSAGPKQTLLRVAGLEPGTTTEGLALARQDEIVGVMPVPARGPATTVANLRRAVADLQRRQVPLAVGISTVHSGLNEVPEAYAEACVARDGLGERPGVIALPTLSSFDYLVLREDETARRMVRPRLRRFIEEDAARGGALITTLTEYIACDRNAKTAARRLHIHVNTAYYRLERIAERTGCDLRSFTGVLELLIAVRLLGSGRSGGS